MRADRASPPTEVGRYQIEGVLGKGGMGTVYAAVDPRLGRRVAIKLIRRRRDAGQRDRLVREAQAMAALSHPNVVNVYEVGTQDDAVFVAMELVDGVTLRDWVSKHAEHWTDVLRVFTEAGRGLSAAHCKGIVHRDFKPSNVLVGEDGRARVLDFGLATVDETSSESGTLTDEDYASVAFADRLTVTGAVMGTPAYMAPEQFRGHSVTVASDQFSFCVALWEGLMGSRPFPGTTIHELRAAVLTEQRTRTSAQFPAPGRVLRAINRGLSINPDDRWPSMDALLLALAHAKKAPRWILGAAALALGGAATWALWPAGPDPCDEAESELAEVWGPGPRAELPDVGVKPALDDYARAWSDTFAAICETARARPEEARTFDGRMRCLTQRRAALGGVLGVLAGGSDEVLEHASSVVAALPSVDACLHVLPGEPSTAVPDDPEVAETVNELRKRVVAAEALSNAGRWEQALVEVQDVLIEAEEVGFGPLLVDAELRLGVVASRGLNRDDAEDLLAGAFWRAQENDYDVAAAEAAIELAWLIGYTHGRHEEGVAWARHYEAITVGRGKDPTDALASVLGPIYFEWDKLDLAEPYLRQRLQRELETDADPDFIAIARMNLGNLYYERGDGVAAEAELRAAVAILERTYPDGHPDLAIAYINLAGVLLDLNLDVDQAQPFIDRGLKASREALGERHAFTALALVKLGEAQIHRREYDQAIETATEALAVYEAGTVSERLMARTVLGKGLREAGRLSEAESMVRGVMTEADSSLGAHHGLTISARINLGAIMEAKGELEKAQALYAEAARRSQGLEHEVAFETRLSLGTALHRLGESAGAEAELRRAVAVAHRLFGGESTQAFRADVALAIARAEEDRADLEALVVEPVTRPIEVLGQAWAMFELARLLEPRDKVRARKLAKAALSRLHAPGGTGAQLRAIETWIAASGG